MVEQSLIAKLRELDLGIKREQAKLAKLIFQYGRAFMQDPRVKHLEKLEKLAKHGASSRRIIKPLFKMLDSFSAGQLKSLWGSLDTQSEYSEMYFLDYYMKLSRSEQLALLHKLRGKISSERNPACERIFREEIAVNKAILHLKDQKAFLLETTSESDAKCVVPVFASYLERIAWFALLVDGESKFLSETYSF